MAMGESPKRGWISKFTELSFQTNVHITITHTKRQYYSQPVLPVLFGGGGSETLC